MHVHGVPALKTLINVFLFSHENNYNIIMPNTKLKEYKL